MDSVSFRMLKKKIARTAFLNGACTDELALALKCKDINDLLVFLSNNLDWINSKLFDFDGHDFDELIYEEMQKRGVPSEFFPENIEEVSKLELIAENYKKYTWFQLKELFNK